MEKELATHQKNTLLKNAQANAESNFFKRVFFSATRKEFKNFLQRLNKKIKTPDTQAMTMQQDNHSGQFCSNLIRQCFGTDRRAAGNI